MSSEVALYRPWSKKAEDRPRINYKSLEQICQLRNGKSHHNIDHAKFMKEYPSIFEPCKPKEHPSEQRWRMLSAQSSRANSVTSPSPVRIRSVSHFLQCEDPDSILLAKLKTMATILEQHPPFRSQADVKKLGSFIAEFPKLFSDVDSMPAPTHLEALAVRAVLERVRERNGIALPREGGVYLILQGSVRELNKIEGSSCRYMTKILGPGEIFGELKEPAYPQKHNYPVYLGYKRSLLMRISVSDYLRAKEIIQESRFQKHLSLIKDSMVLSKFPQSVQQKLAKLIKWRKLRPCTKLVQEGELIKAVSIIKQGHCKVFMKVPGTNGQSVCIGEICESGCIGELLFDDPDAPSPYTVISTTNMVTAIISIKDMAADIEAFCTSRGPSQKVYSVLIPSIFELRALYAERVASQQWNSLKRGFVSGISTRNLN